MASLITWGPSLEVGIKAIDEQHKTLVKLINDLNDAMSSGRGKLSRPLQTSNRNSTRGAPRSRFPCCIFFAIG
jgi:hypothetical protein